MPQANPWAHSRTEDERHIANQAEQQYAAYAVPSLAAGDAYQDEFGWAPTLAPRTSSVETPSAQRLGTIPRYEYRPDPALPPDVFWQKEDADREYRYSVEDQSTIGYETRTGVAPGDRRWAPNPRSTPPPEPRPMDRMGPSTYNFTRFFDQFNRTHLGDPLTGSARRFNGMHFSMADHRRKYDILGMAPQRSRRNTYRLEPAPWDVDVVDMPPPASVANARIQALDVPYTNRSLRLM